LGNSERKARKRAGDKFTPRAPKVPTPREQTTARQKANLKIARQLRRRFVAEAKAEADDRE
jgi:hypothetical protein